MPLSRDEIFAAAMKLSRPDRAKLAHRLIGSLDDAEDGNFEAGWVEEAERRYADYRVGRVAARDADEVFREARRRLE